LPIKPKVVFLIWSPLPLMRTIALKIESPSEMIATQNPMTFESFKSFNRSDLSCELVSMHISDRWYLTARGSAVPRPSARVRTNELPHSGHLNVDASDPGDRSNASQNLHLDDSSNVPQRCHNIQSPPFLSVDCFWEAILFFW
jgi:hypothetical protein